MPTYHNEISTQIKSNLEPGAANQSKQRLGFTWWKSEILLNYLLLISIFYTQKIYIFNSYMF